MDSFFWDYVKIQYSIDCSTLCFANITFSLDETQVEIKLDTVVSKLLNIHPLGILIITFSINSNKTHFGLIGKKNSISFNFHIT